SMSRPCTMGMPAVNMVENCLVKIIMSFSDIFCFLGPKSLKPAFFSEMEVGVIPCFLRLEISSSLLPADISPVFIAPEDVFPAHTNVVAMQNYETNSTQKQAKKIEKPLSLSLHIMSNPDSLSCFFSCSSVFLLSRIMHPVSFAA